MTVTTPESGFRARLRRLARPAVVFVIALSIGGSAGVAFAADEADAENGTIALQLSAGLRGTVAPGSALPTTLTVQNETVGELAAGRVLVEWSRAPLADDAAITGWLDEGSSEAEFETLGFDTTARVDAGDTTNTTLLIPAENLGVAPGVYPLRATLSGATDSEGDEREAVTTSVLVVTEASSTQIAVLVPITATPASGGMLTAEELTALTAADGALTAQLDGLEGSAAILAIDPSIPAAIRALGTAAPDTATEWLTRLDELPNDRFVLQFGDADAATQAQAGLTTLLQPTTLAPFLNPDDFAAPVQPAPTATPTPSPTPTSGPVLPDDAALTQVTGAADGILWPRGDLSEADLAAFSGYLGDGTTTILPSSAVGDRTAGHATVGTHDVLVTATAASDALSRAADEEDEEARQRWLAAASAHLYLASQNGAPLLVGLDRDESRPADALRDAVATADVTGFGLSALRAAPASASDLTSEPDPERALKLQLMLDDEVALGEFSSILEDPQVLLSPERIELLRVLGVGSSDTRFAEAVTAELTETREILNAVAIPPSSTIQLLSANADLPFSVRNDLPWPVTVRLTVSPTDPRLEVRRVTEEVVQGDSSTRIKVPVSSRVGSGEVDLRLELTSLTGVPLGDQQLVRVAVRAEWETIGLSIFGGLAVVLIGLGIVRTVRRKRREADADSEANAGDAEDDSAEVSA